MKVKELQALLASANPEDEVVIPVQRLGVVRGAQPALSVTTGHNGFDWDIGKFMLFTGALLREIDRDELTTIRKQIDNEEGPYHKTMCENFLLKRQIEDLQNQLKGK